MRHAVWSIAAGLAGVVLCGLSSAGAADDASFAPASRIEPVAVAPARVVRGRAHTAPPVLMAQTAVPVTPIIAAPPLAAPVVAAPGVVPAVVAPRVVAQGNVVRIITPTSSQPGALWVIAMGAVLCRIGARVLRVS